MKKFLLILMVLLCIAFPVTASQGLIQVQEINTPVIVNGSQIQINLPIFTYNDRTYVPLKTLSECTGASVNWDGANKKIFINIQNNPNQNNYSVYLLKLKVAIISAFDTANNQFNMHLGLLKFPGSDTSINILNLQSYRREAKSTMLLDYFTDQNKYYKEISNSSNSNIKTIIESIKTDVSNGMDYYIEAANNRASNNNPNDYTSSTTDFWNLRGAGNGKLMNAMSTIDSYIVD